MRKREDKELEPSGVEWLGEIPASWELTKIKSVFEQRNEKVSDKDYAALSVTKNGVLPQLENVAKTDNGDARKLVLKGDFVINSRSDRKSSSGVSPLDGSVSLINIVMHNRYDNVWMPFAHHMFKSHMFCEEFYARGNGMVADLWSTNWNKMRFIDIALPPLDEQQRIASFLDSETSKIDSLSDELTKFKANLQLQKRSLVSECVTKGMPSERDRAYKDSGVEWLGDIPVEWGLSKIKYVAKLTTGSTPEGKADEFFAEDGMPWVRPSNLNDSDEITGDIIKLSKDGIKEVRVVSANSIAIVCIGTLGKVGLCKEDFATNQQINTLTYKSNMSFKYGFYFNLALHDEYVKTGMSVTLPIMNKTQHGNVLHLVPPLDEQQRIAVYLDTETAKIDALIGEIDNQVNLLKTYRKSLINEVITGKLEV